MTKPTSIDDYLATLPASTAALLQDLRRAIQGWAPEATETISYGIPTFKLKRNLVHFAGFDKHIGLYPGPSGIAAFEAELGPYKHAKGSVQFPLDRPLPMDLIERIVRYRVAEEAGR